mgnify:CR=1 FL=1
MMFQYSLIDNNTYRNNGSTAGCSAAVYLKHGIGNMTVRRLTAYENNYWRRSVIRCDDTNHASNEVVNMEFLYNNSDNEFGAQALVSAPGTNSVGDGPHFVFRNTGRNATLDIDGDSTDSEMIGNVMGSTDLSSAAFATDTDNYFSVSETNQNADGTLTDAYLLSISKDRGTVGHEII